MRKAPVVALVATSGTVLMFGNFFVAEKATQKVVDLANSTAEQKQCGENIVKSMELLGKIAGENLRLSSELAKSADESLLQINSLQSSIGRFRVD